MLKITSNGEIIYRNEFSNIYIELTPKSTWIEINDIWFFILGDKNLQS